MCCMTSRSPYIIVASRLSVYTDLPIILEAVLNGFLEVPFNAYELFGYFTAMHILQTWMEVFKAVFDN